MRGSVKLLGIMLTVVLLTGLTGMSRSEAAQTREIQFYTPPVASSIHTIAVAMCDMLKKHSPWLRGTAEVAWGIDGLKLWARDPARKKTGVANMMPVNLWEAERQGLLKGMKPLVLMKTITNNQFWMTFDPAIKSVLDFPGKRVSVGKKGSGLAMGPEYMFKEARVYDKTKISYLDFDGSATAFLDKTLDAAWGTAVIGRTKGMPAPAFTEISISDKTFHFVGVEQKWVDAVRKNTGYPLYAITMPKGTMGKNQPDPLLTIETAAFWFATTDLDNDVVYELCRVMWEHYDELANYIKVASLLVRDDLPTSPFPSSAYHPAAIKYFTEKKVKIGG